VSPLSDVDAALDEIACAGRAEARGIGLLTSDNGANIAMPQFDPVWQELNRRKCMVFMHPTSPQCATREDPAASPSRVRPARSRV
jgi:hypothetical protein